ncbi:MAG: formylglycine-generating enzyme family protein [Bacteroidales bacterium]|jgi:formylglycine-generating enzyme required for sulfatase activity|nr:formylglycine-generating enzyme family protein [Bacteroidales bacterium]
MKKPFKFGLFVTLCVTAMSLNSCKKDKDNDREILTSINTQGSVVQTFQVGDVLFTMVEVKGGTFNMGSNDGDSDEQPIHSVTLSTYSIGETEVTQALWKAVTNHNPSTFSDDENSPVEQVTWNDVQGFITKLNTLTGKTFHLPTEAEWEYAARGGNKSAGHIYSGSDTVNNVAWFANNSGSKTHTVASKQPNELGIYDMSGNVWEYCSDWHGSYSSDAQINPTGATTGSDRVYRGGSWNNSAFDSRATNRFSKQNVRTDAVGFRLVLP